MFDLKLLGLLVVSFILLLTSCNSSRNKLKENHPAPVPEEEMSEKLTIPSSPKEDNFIAVDEYSLGQSISEVNLSNFAKYGNFYSDRLKIYHIDNVKALKENRYVTEVYLFFIDNRLSKIETILTKDQSSRFLIQYGNCTLQPKDHLNIEYLKNHGALQSINGKLRLNPKLTNYMLTWKKSDFNVHYRVQEPNYEQLSNIDDETLNSKAWKYLYEPQYRYMIQLKDYKHRLFDLRNSNGFYTN